MPKYLIEVHYTDPVNFFSRSPDGIVVDADCDDLAIAAAITIARHYHSPFTVVGTRIFSKDGVPLEPQSRAARFRKA